MNNIDKRAIMAGVIVAIVLIILGINFLQESNGQVDDIDCIARKSKLYVSSTCGHCAQQKEILGEEIDQFEVINCLQNREECEQVGIRAVPTWIINDEKYLGVKTWDELKEMTNC